VRAGDTNEAFQMLDLLLEFFADSGCLPWRQARSWRTLISSISFAAEVSVHPETYITGYATPEGSHRAPRLEILRAEKLKAV
jgi:hypothetical protein